MFRQNVDINALTKWWLFFMVCFAIARYPLAICVTFGLIGGVAGGILARWWQLDNDPEPVKQTIRKSRLPKAVELFRDKIKVLDLQRRINPSQRKGYQSRRQRQRRVKMFRRTSLPYNMRSSRRRKAAEQSAEEQQSAD